MYMYRLKRFSLYAYLIPSKPSLNKCIKVFLHQQQKQLFSKPINTVSHVAPVYSNLRNLSAGYVSVSAEFDRLKRFKKKSLKKAGVSPELNMDPSILWPPEGVRGMQELNESAFNKTITVPTVKVNVACIELVMKKLKKHLLKFRHFTNIKECADNETTKLVYLNPLSFFENEQQIRKDLSEISVSFNKNSDLERAVDILETHLELGYNQWHADEVLRAILPLDEYGVGGYSIVGHIIHLNLRDQIMAYKKIIGEVLLDKHERIHLVVNKVDTVDHSDNSFRSFNMEVLAGEGETIVTVKENGVSLTLDFSKVYWNPRLSREHERIVEMLESGDVLYDLMAGVGPFAVPAARKRCDVLANDLNPHSYEWLVKNAAANKVKERLECHNLDAAAFIKTHVKEDLMKRWQDHCFEGAIHITMNLPSLAVTFLPNFVGLMADFDNSSDTIKVVEPLIHVYMFSKDQKPNSCVMKVAYYLGYIDTLPDFDGVVTEMLKDKFKLMNPESSDTSQSVVNTQNGKPDDSCVNDNRSTVKELQSNIISKKGEVCDLIIPGLKVKEVVYVRKVAPNKAMMRVSVYLSKQLLMSKRNLNVNLNKQGSEVLTSHPKRENINDVMYSEDIKSAKKFKV